MLYFLAFLFYYDDKKQQLSRPSEESNCFRSCRLGYNSDGTKTQKLVFSQLLYLTLSVKGTALVMLVMTTFKTQNLRKF